MGIAAAAHIVLALTNYPPFGDDGDNHIHWINEFIAAKAEGIFYPRWTGGSLQGFGLPSFYFYPPLAYVAAYAVHLVLPAATASVEFNLVQLAASLLSAVTFWLFVRGHIKSTLILLVSSLCYAFGPYRFTDAYLRSALGEQLAFVWLPLIFLALEWLRTKNKLGGTVLLAISISALLLTNIPTFVLACYALIVYCLCTYRDWDRQTILYGLGAVVLSLAVTSIYWLPLLELRLQVQLEHLNYLGKSGYSDYSFALTDLILGNAHHLWQSLMMLVGGVAAALVLYHTRAQREGRPWFWLTLLAMVVQIPFLSLPLWKWLPLFDLVQFSWRWDVLLTFTIPVAIASLLTEEVAGKCYRLIVPTVLLLLVVASNLPTALTTVTRHLESPSLSSVNPAAFDVLEYAPKTAPHTLDSMQQLFASNAKFPEITVLRPLQRGESDTLLVRASALTRFHADLHQPAMVRFHRFYWSTWRLTEENFTTGIRIFPDSTGILSAELPAGSSNYTLSIVPTDGELIGAWFSLVGCIVAGILAVVAFQQHRDRIVTT